MSKHDREKSIKPYLLFLSLGIILLLILYEEQLPHFLARVINMTHGVYEFQLPRIRHDQPSRSAEVQYEPQVISTTEPSTQRTGDTLRLLYWEAPNILNPHLTKGVKEVEVCRIVYEPLASFDKEGQLIPFLAADIPSRENGGVAADGKSVTWKLKQGIHWSDGQPFTAADVQFTYEFITNPAVNAASALVYSAVKDVTILDDYTIKVEFNEVNPAWFVPFVGIYGVIIPKHKFEAYNGANAQKAPANLIPVGTGPYQVLSPGIKPQEILFLGTKLLETNKIVFTPNPFFREADKIYFSRIELKGNSTANEAARLVLQTDQIDYAFNLAISEDDISELSTNANGRFVFNFGTSVHQIELNWTDPNKETADGERSSLKFPHPFFTNPKIRQAFAYAFDRKTIAALYGSTGQPTEHILVSPPQYKSDKVFYEFNLDKAAALLNEANWVDSDGDGIRDKNGRKLSILFQTYINPVTQEVQHVYEKALESLGIEVELKFISASIFYGANYSDPDHNIRFHADMQLTGWAAISPDPGLFLQYWTCEQIPQKANNWSGFNFRRWCNRDYDALYKQSRLELDPEKRRQLFIKMNDMLTEEVVTIPIVRRARISGISQDLEGFDYTPWDAETWNIKDWRRTSR